jgi:hypothetical protein
MPEGHRALARRKASSTATSTSPTSPQTDDLKCPSRKPTRQRLRRHPPNIAVYARFETATNNVIAALMSFRMVSLLPHHLPRLVGFTSANRVDMDAFQQRAAWAPSGLVASGAANAIEGGGRQFGNSVQQLPRGPAGYISGSGKASDDVRGGSANMDSTLRASTESSPIDEGDADV